MAENSRLNEEIKAEMAQAQQLQQESGQAARVFKDFRYRTRRSWTCERRWWARRNIWPREKTRVSS